VADQTELAGLETERRRADLADLDLRPTSELVRLVLAEQDAVDRALAFGAEALTRAVDAVSERMGRGGRLIYLGAGTPGRLAALDAAECPPTFGVSPDRVVALLAGGNEVLLGAREGVEDDQSSAAADLVRIGLGTEDSVVGVSASGRTPYVVHGLVAAHSRGALTVSLACNTQAKISAEADIAIEVPTGPELIAGSTRLKAGTAQKIVLGALSTLVMVRLGYTYGNLMVDVMASNEKLRYRAERIVVEATGATAEQAREALRAAEGHAKTAVVMLLGGLEVEQARARLAGDVSVREALAGG
jgi:N-acetylmuramic acid 6-phosphate etherase